MVGVSVSPVTTAFVGRQRELSFLADVLDAAQRGRGSIVCVAGEAGVGKTRFALEAGELAHQRGMAVLVGRAYESADMAPYWPLVEALRGHLRSLPPEAVTRALGPYTADLVLLLPELRDALPAEVEPDAPPAPVDRYTLYEQVGHALRALAGEAGLLLVLDDVHWADEPTLLLLGQLADHVEHSPIVVLAQYREHEAALRPALQRALSHLTRRPSGQRVTLSGMSESEVAALVAQLTDMAIAQTLAATIHAETGGNPFFLTELLRLFQDEGRLSTLDPTTLRRHRLPPTVQEAISRRLEHLSDDCQRALAMAAIVGREFSITTLSHLGETRSLTLLDALEEAETARLIQPLDDATGRFNFAHPLLREVLYRQLPASRRLRLHRQVGEALERLHEADPEPHLAELAFHFVQAAPLGEQERAVRYARLAGDRALRQFAYEEAVRQYRAALTVVESLAIADGDLRCTLHLAIGDALSKGGDTPNARDTFRQAADLAGRLGRADLLAHAGLGYGGYRSTFGIVEPFVIETLDGALAGLTDDADPLRARALARLAMELYYGDDQERRSALAEEAVAVARRSGDTGALVAALVGRHYALHQPGNTIDRLATASELIHHAESAGVHEVELQGRYLRIFDLLEIADVAGADREIAQHDRLALALRQPLYRWRTDLLRAMRALLDGRLAEGEALAEQAYAIAHRAGIPNALQAYGAQILLLRWEQGRLDEIVPQLTAMQAAYPGTAAWRAALGLALAESGDLAAARVQFDQNLKHNLTDLAADESYTSTLFALTQLCHLLSDADRAAVIADLLQPYAQRLVITGGAVTCWGPVSLALAILAATRARWDEAEQHAHQALATAQRIDARPWIAHARYHRASIYLARSRGDDRARASADIEQALAIADACGQTRLAERCRALRDALDRPEAGARQRSSETALSGREREVLARLAAGRTAKEIAVDLVVSVRTVEHHIANIYNKINANGRAEAVAYALRHGLV